MDKLRLVLERKTPYSEMSEARSSIDSYKVLKPLYEDVIEYKERVILLCLNRKNKIVGSAVISDGGISGTIIDIRIIMQNALLSNSSAIIISHNHPSGNLKPSHTDIEMTKKIKEAGKIMDIELLDHLIITNAGYYSFADKGIL